MNFEEHAAKPILARAGIAIPRGQLAATPEEAAAAAAALGPVVVKAQVPTGKRGKAGGIRPADSPQEARAAAQAILGLEIAGHRVARLLVEERARIAKEYYAAVLNDPKSRGPLVLFSTLGGMEVEAAAGRDPAALRQAAVDIRAGFSRAAAAALAAAVPEAGVVAAALVALYRAYRDNDAELLEINPLAVTANGAALALDCKFVLDDSAVVRREALARAGAPEPLSALEARGQEYGLKYIALDGEVGIIANGAGLTMTTMDVVRHCGGRPANFLEIGGQAYTKGSEALGLVLANPKVRSLVVNFCGAFARTDVMTESLVSAWAALRPDLPVFFSIHGTGDRAARAILRERLGLEPLATMDQACRAAVEAAR